MCQAGETYRCAALRVSPLPESRVGVAGEHVAPATAHRLQRTHIVARLKTPQHLIVHIHGPDAEVVIELAVAVRRLGGAGTPRCPQLPLHPIERSNIVVWL